MLPKWDSGVHDVLTAAAFLSISSSSKPILWLFTLVIDLERRGDYLSGQTDVSTKQQKIYSMNIQKINVKNEN